MTKMTSYQIANSDVHMSGDANAGAGQFVTDASTSPASSTPRGAALPTVVTSLRAATDTTAAIR